MRLREDEMDDTQGRRPAPVGRVSVEALMQAPDLHTAHSLAWGAAFQDGQGEAARGTMRDESPYAPGTELATAWDMGWLNNFSNR